MRRRSSVREGKVLSDLLQKQSNEIYHSSVRFHDNKDFSEGGKASVKEDCRKDKGPLPKLWQDRVLRLECRRAAPQKLRSSRLGRS